MTDPRIQELKDFELESGAPLPMFPWQIIELEDTGYTVDLESGAIYASVTVELAPNAQAVSYLLGQVEGVVAI